MGRALKRVPLDFAHPWQGKAAAWPGYRNPHYRKCPACDGTGSTVDMQWLKATVYLLMMCGEPQRNGLHPWLRDVALRPNAMPTPAMSELTRGLAGRAPGMLGHDAIDQWVACKAVIKAACLDPETWGVCPKCEGEGMDPAVKEAYEAWEPYDPPTGDGFQMWETTSEGSPSSPVFKTLDELCEWLAPNASWFGAQKASKADWLHALGGEGVSGLMVLEVGTGRMSVDGLDLPDSSRDTTEEV